MSEYLGVQCVVLKQVLVFQELEVEVHDALRSHA